MTWENMAEVVLQTQTYDSMKLCIISSSSTSTLKMRVGLFQVARIAGMTWKNMLQTPSLPYHSDNFQRVACLLSRS